MSASSKRHQQELASRARAGQAAPCQSGPFGAFSHVAKLPMQLVVHNCPQAARNALSQTCKQGCFQVRPSSACSLRLRGCQGRAVADLDPHRQFGACTALTYSCSMPRPQQRQEQQQQQQTEKPLPEQLEAVEALLQRAPQQMPHLSSVRLSVGSEGSAESAMDRQAARSLYSCLSALGGLPHLTNLSVILPECSERLPALLGSLSQLQHLHLELSDPVRCQQVQLSQLSWLENLISFTCAGLAPATPRKTPPPTSSSSRSSSSSGIGGGSCLPTSSLTSLTLSRCGQFTGAWAQHVAAAGCLQVLEVQDITPAQVDDLVAQLAKGAPALRQLVLKLAHGHWSPRPGLPALEGLETLLVRERRLHLSHPDHWRWLGDCRSLIRLGGLIIQWSEQVPQPPAGVQLLRLAIAHVTLTPTTKQQLAALLSCFPAVEQLVLTMQHTEVVQQQQQQQGQQQQEESEEELVQDAAHATGAQQHRTAQGAGQALPPSHSMAVAAAEQHLVTAQLLARPRQGVAYRATTLPAAGPLESLELVMLPGATASPQQLQQALEALAPLFGSVIHLTLDLTQWPHTPEQGGMALDLSCFPQLVVLELHAHQLQLRRVTHPQLWQLTSAGRSVDADQLEGPQRAEALVNCYRRMAAIKGEVLDRIRVLRAIYALGMAEMRAWARLLPQVLGLPQHVNADAAYQRLFKKVRERELMEASEDLMKVMDGQVMALVRHPLGST